MEGRNQSDHVLSSHCPRLPLQIHSLVLATSLFSSLYTSHLSSNFSIYRMEEDPTTMDDEEWPMVERDGAQLLVKNEPFVIHGFNTYWLMIFAVDPETRHKVTDVFTEAKEAGLNTCRTWAFNDGGWRALQVSPYEYDEELFQALDFVVSEARKHRIRLILPLCNNWEDYGGKSQYVKWGQSSGLDLSSDDDFFSDATIKDYYKAFVEAVLTRTNTITDIEYKNDATILAWELINEPRCPSDPSGDVLQAWIEEMASYVKSVDSVHLLAVGSEGFYGPCTPELLELNPNENSGEVGTDFIRNHQASGIDLASVHIYPDTWLSHSDQEDHLDFVQKWMDQHISDCKDQLNMPIVFGEFGVSLKDDRFCSDFRELFMEKVYATFMDSIETGGPGGGCLLWQLFPEGAEHMDDGYAIFLAKYPSTYSLLSLQSKRLCADNGMEEDSSTMNEEWPMVEKDGAQLLVKNEPFVIHGFNTYWLMVFAVEAETRHKITDVFIEAKEAGLNTCRTWAFNDGGSRALQVSPFNYDEEVFQALDFVVSEARKYGIRLILPLCNNWEDYGGKSQYVKWGQSSGLDLSSDDDFFFDATLKDYYKAFVEAVLTRTNTITNIEYKNDATILAWELINEPRCPSDPSGDILQAWIEEMASHVKSIDPVHLLAVGSEGFYGPSTPELLELNPNENSGEVGTDFVRNNQASGIDLASVHIYPDTWLSHSDQEDHLDFVQKWMDQHISDCRDQLNMPIIFGEFGVSLKDDRFGSDFRDSFMDKVYTTFTSSIETGGPGGGCILWQLFPEGAEHMDDGYAIFLAKYPSTYSLLSLQSKRLSDGAQT